MSRNSTKVRVTNPQGHIHARSLKTNPTLQRVDKLLSDLRPHSTREIVRRADVCAVNSIVSELRHPKNGRKINSYQDGKYFYHRRVR